jgi:TetR/AcrR family transcriptional repressor of mexJK operon
MRSDCPSAPRRRSRKREAIIVAAKDMFFREGYAGASMDRITAHAGVSKATVYSHFRSKEELLLAVVVEVVAPIRDDYLSVPDHSASFETWLLELAEILAQKVLLPEVTALERLVIAETLRFPELGRIFQSIAINSSFEVLRPRIERAIADGEMRPCDPIIAVGHFVEMCAGAMRRRMLFNEGGVPDAAEIERHVREVVEVFLHGYGVREKKT